MEQFGKMLGWIGAIGYLIALLNFFMKYINKKYINKLSKDKKKYVDVYRFVMKYVVKYHRVAGVIATLAIIIHFFIMYNYRWLSMSGLYAAIAMWIIFALGIYGTKINKNIRGPWVKIHRVLSFILILLVVWHIYL